MVRVWKTISLLFCLRYDPLILFRRQNHVTFIFMKTVTWPLSANGLFRFLRQSKPDRYPWDNVARELWHQALHSALTTSRPSSNNDFRTRRPNQRPFQSFPKGVCWRFHSRQFCTGCNFKHSCFKCGSVHPATQCAATRSNANNCPAPSLPSGSDSQGRASVEPRANPGKARPTRVLP